MRFWYVVGDHEYWLQPEYQETKTGKVRIIGAKLYDAKNTYKGYWQYKLWPTVVQQGVRADLLAWLKNQKRLERIERNRIGELDWLKDD